MDPSWLDVFQASMLGAPLTMIATDAASRAKSAVGNKAIRFAKHHCDAVTLGESVAKALSPKRRWSTPRRSLGCSQ